ncbi:hypothetical protein [Cytobacillus sp. IB215665]|uniref:hypothetical protein n=1 Tax=Cytobacillus sp. IB215665 TaxID=3097357 RepID=UPI002A11EFFA|nr:hypothetical protein [Cytobacillus sp. IB215665]MDX8366762.1 hypothetical protein [Cytobacillus sp. IB215665]
MPFTIIFIVLLLTAVLIINHHIKFWVRGLFGIYYAGLIYIFSRGYNELTSDKASYSLEVFWDLRSAYVDNYVIFFALPLLGLIIYSYYLWFINGKNKKQKVLIAISVVPVGLFYLYSVVMFGMLGYQP